MSTPAGARSLGEPRYTILYHHRTQSLDGQRVHIREIQDALRADGHRVIEVSVLKSDEPAGAPPARTWIRSLLELFQRRAPLWIRECLEYSYNGAGWLAVVRAAARHRPDFIYERYALHTVAGIWAARWLGIPLLLEVNSPLAAERDQQTQGQFRFSRLSHAIERYVFRRATRVLAVSQVLADLIVRDAQLDPSKVEVVHNGVCLRRFEAAGSQRPALPHRLPPDRVVLGAVAFFLPWHGIDGLVRVVAASAMLRAKACILLVGEGPALPDLRALVDRHGLADLVSFAGPVPHHDIPAILASIDIAVIPRAVPYASPLKLFDYMAAGTAIIAPRQANVLEVATEGAEILCFTPGDDRELEQRLVALVISDAERRRLGEAAAARLSRDERTWQANARRIVNAFEQTSAGAGRLPSVGRPATL